MQATSLLELVDNTKTDKNTTHSYLSLYETFFAPRRYSSQNVLEVGIGGGGDCNGGSIKLWRDYFPEATIYALDIIPFQQVWDGIKGDYRIRLYTSVDAYDESFVQREFVNKGSKFDVLIDDGPHTLDSQKQFIRLYAPLLAEGGVLVIEDIQSIDWFEELRQVVPEELKPFVQTYDLRENKGRYDDLVFAIQK